jgi:adenine-specific DNA-methyltransferase
MTTDEKSDLQELPAGWRVIAHGDMTSQSSAESTKMAILWNGIEFRPAKGGWKTNAEGAQRLVKATRLLAIGNSLRYRRRFTDFANIPTNNLWTGFRTSGFSDSKV